MNRPIANLLFLPCQSLAVVRSQLLVVFSGLILAILVQVTHAGLQETLAPATDNNLVQQDEVARWIRALNSPEFRERQRASHELWKLGPERTVRPLLEVIDQGDLESGKRAQAILDRFRLGLVPGLNPSLARQILSFESGNSSQRLNCVDRLLTAGHVRSALALIRSAEDHRNEAWFESVFYSPDQYVNRWLRDANWEAMDTFFSDPDIVARHPYFCRRYAVGTHRVTSLIAEMSAIKTSNDTRPVEDRVAQFLGGPELSLADARRLIACLQHQKHDYTAAMEALAQVPDSQQESFRLAFSAGDFQEAARRVTELQDAKSRPFVLPEEDIARKLCQALLLGWSDQREAMRTAFSEIKAGGEQDFSLACAMAASGDPALLEPLLKLSSLDSPSAKFEFHNQLEQWEAAFAAIEFPIEAGKQEQLKWLSGHLETLNNAGDEYSSDSTRSLLLTVADALEDLGRHGISQDILNALAELPLREGQGDYSRVELCRRAVQMGNYDWAIGANVRFWEEVQPAGTIAIWFPDHPHASFWFQELQESERKYDFLATGDLQERQKRFRMLLGAVGRITRSSGVQTIEPERFMDLEEVLKTVEHGLQLARRGGFDQLDALQATIQLMWDYRLWDSLADLDLSFIGDELPTEYRRLQALAVWKSGEPEKARRKLWDIYWQDSAAYTCLLFTTLPADFPLFSWTPDLAGQTLAETELQQRLRPWEWSESDLQEAKSLQQRCADMESPDWQEFSEQQLILLARLHWMMRPLPIHVRNDLARTMNDLGAERLAAWQTLEFKNHAIWTEAEQMVAYAANSMLGYVHHAAPEMRKLWRAELIVKSLLNYPIAKSGLYASFGLAIRNCELQQALLRDDVATAEQLAAEVREFHPHDIDQIEYLTAWYDQKGQPDRADDFFEQGFNTLKRVQEQFPDSPLLANNLAWMCVQGNRKLDVAEQKVRRAILLDPGVSNYPDTLADVLWKRGKTSEALDWNQRSQDLAPNRTYYRMQRNKLEQPFEPTAAPAALR